MDNENQLVAEKIDSGSYFAEALSWYNSRFTFVQSQFSQMLIVTIIAIFAFLTAFFGFIRFLPIVDKQLFVVYSDITPQSYLSVKSLMEPGADANLALTEYYIKEYVRAREEYVVDRSERDFNYVYSMSGQDALDNYLASVSPDNPNSPFVIYANRGSRIIQVNKVTFPKNSKNHAVVNFSAQETFGSAADNIINYEANIDFSYKNIEVDQKTHQLTKKPEMVITNYTTKQISGTTK